jgi:hypothetical protein
MEKSKPITPEKASSTWERLEDFVRNRSNASSKPCWKKKSPSYWGVRSWPGERQSMQPPGIGMAMETPTADVDQWNYHRTPAPCPRPQ